MTYLKMGTNKIPMIKGFLCLFGTWDSLRCKINKYYHFWLGLIICIFLIGLAAKYDLWSFAVLGSYILGYYKLTKF